GTVIGFAAAVDLHKKGRGPHGPGGVHHLVDAGPAGEGVAHHPDAPQRARPAGRGLHSRHRPTGPLAHAQMKAGRQGDEHGGHQHSLVTAKQGRPPLSAPCAPGARPGYGNRVPVAKATAPWPAPTNPSPSDVVALMLMRSGGTSRAAAMRTCIAGTWGARRGRSSTTVASTLPTRKPAARTRRPTSSSRPRLDAPA